MTLFLFLLINLFPLYILIALGYFAGRFLHVDRQMLASLTLYIFMPIMMFGFVADLEFQKAYALLPVIVYIFSACVALPFLWIGRRVFHDNRANLLAMCASMGNTGYFGLPVAMLLFDAHGQGVYMFMLMGIVVFEGTIGYYLAARGKFTVRDSLVKLSKFPALYATALGLLVNFSGIELPDLFYTYWGHIKGAYVVIGMMIIGAALARVDKFQLAPRFLSLALAGKFIVWPLVTFLFIALDRAYLNLFDEEIYPLLYLIAIVPFAANIVAFAAQMDLKPEKAAMTILTGTLLALVYIPVMLALLTAGN